MRGPTQAQRGSLRVLKALSMQHHKETQIHKGRMVTKARETSTFRVMWVPAPACPSHPSVTAHYVHLVPPGWAYRYRCFSYILSLASSCSHRQSTAEPLSRKPHGILQGPTLKNCPWSCSEQQQGLRDSCLLLGPRTQHCLQSGKSLGSNDDNCILNVTLSKSNNP